MLQLILIVHVNTCDTREAKAVKKREDAWTALEKLALMSPHVDKLSSPQNTFRKSMLSGLTSITAEDVPDKLPTSDEIKSGDQAVVSLLISTPFSKLYIYIYIHVHDCM